MHKQPVYNRGEKREEKREMYTVVTCDSSISYVNGVSEGLFRRGLCLPSGPMVSDDEVRYIIQTIKDNIAG